MTTELFPCPICKNTHADFSTHMQTLKGVDRIKCERCGLIYFDPPSRDDKIYSADYSSAFYRPGDIRKAGIFAATLAELQERFTYAPKFLEVGPGNGLVTFLLREMGFPAEATDISPTNARRLERKYGFTCYSKPLEELSTDLSYNVIFAGHLIEHVIDPINWLRKANALLKDKGLLYIDTPDAYYARNQGLFWRHFRTRNPFEHCSLFENRTMHHAARTANFKIIRERASPMYESMQILLQKV
jgi:SAM-dependent methyltransferase